MNKQQSKYVRLADQLLRILKHCRIPLYLHRKSNHIYTVWQHIVLVTIRHSMKVRVIGCLQIGWLKHTIWGCFSNYPKYHIIQHYRNLQIESINIMMLGKIISFFILFTGTRYIFTSIDSTEGIQNYTCIRVLYTSRAKLRKKYAKLLIGADVLHNKSSVL